MTQLLIFHMSSTSTRLNATVEQPRWPGRPFHVACPTGTLAEHCALLSRTSKMAVVRERKGPGCSEPEDDTAEVLSSLLEGCDTRNCLYVDVGCNIGYFAMHAAALGAHVDCAEPTPFYVDAINTSIALNHFPEGQVKLRQVAITAAPAKPAVPRDGIPYSWRMVMQASSASDPSELTFSSAYAPCDIGLAEQRRLRNWKVPTIPLEQLLRGRRVDLLKIDVDSIEGALLHTVVVMVRRDETRVQSILIELGDDALGFAHCENGTSVASNALTAYYCKRYASSRPSAHGPRFGDADDLWQMQHELNYR